MPLVPNLPDRLSRCLLTLAVCAMPSWPLSLAEEAEDERRWSPAFEKLDADLDNRLSEDEFLKQSQAPSNALRRDFRLFDFNQDGQLGKLEFAAAFGVLTSGRPQGPIPDPFNTLAEQAIEAIDQSYDNWILRPTESVPARQFVTNFMQSISTDGNASVSGRLLQQADPDGDQSVTRTEASQFLLNQLGVLSDDSLLRDDRGRVVDFARFLSTDVDRDGEISAAEFRSFWPDADSLDADFAACDRDSNGRITIAEYTDADGPNWIDSLNWFREADQNFDAKIDREELGRQTAGRQRHLLPSTFDAFDDNEDGLLSLGEYRLSMHGNHNYLWDALPRDRNDDRQITFDEFEFNVVDRFQLQRRYYFHRLDLNHDQALSQNEFPFRQPGTSFLAMLSIDGTESQQLYRVDQGGIDSPDITGDGQRVLFHQTVGDESNRSRIFRLDLQTRQVEEVCEGRQPSWSADGTRFVCTRVEDAADDSAQSVWIVGQDGENQQRIADGWGAKWSPDGRSIAYLFKNSLWSYDVPSGAARQVLQADDHSYQFFWWNMDWSPDSRQLVIRGVSQGRSDAMLVPMRGQADPQIRLSETVELGTDFSWSPDGRQILFPMRDTRRRTTQIFGISANDQDNAARQPAFPIASLESQFEPKSGCFTPDGRWYICVFEH